MVERRRPGRRFWDSRRVDALGDVSRTELDQRESKWRFWGRDRIERERERTEREPRERVRGHGTKLFRDSRKVNYVCLSWATFPGQIWTGDGRDDVSGTEAECSIVERWERVEREPRESVKAKATRESRESQARGDCEAEKDKVRETEWESLRNHGMPVNTRERYAASTIGRIEK